MLLADPLLLADPVLPVPVLPVPLLAEPAPAPGGVLPAGLVLVSPEAGELDAGDAGVEELPLAGVGAAADTWGLAVLDG